jgi:hypothetical protein
VYAAHFYRMLGGGRASVVASRGISGLHARQCQGLLASCHHCALPHAGHGPTGSLIESEDCSVDIAFAAFATAIVATFAIVRVFAALGVATVAGVAVATDPE